MRLMDALLGPGGTPTALGTAAALGVLGLLCFVGLRLLISRRAAAAAKRAKQKLENIQAHRKAARSQLSNPRQPQGVTETVSLEQNFGPGGEDMEELAAEELDEIEMRRLLDEHMVRIVP